MFSEEFIIISIVVLFTIGILAFVFWFLKRTYAKVEVQWKQLAEDLGLNIDIPESNWRWIMQQYPSVYGNYEGFQISCYTFARRSGKHTVIYTGFQMHLDNSKRKTLSLYKEGFFSKIGKALGGQDIQIGHDEFDKKFIIKSNDDRFAKSLLDPRMRDLVLRKSHLFASDIELTEEDELKYEARLQIAKDSQREDFVDLIKLTTTLAKRIQELNR
ncbi:MAG: hypothetical protein GY810_08685 [Aureispira sp.]|nr:hypothetical protein [Aureispira sp.]